MSVDIEDRVHPDKGLKRGTRTTTTVEKTDLLVGGDEAEDDDSQEPIFSDLSAVERKRIVKLRVHRIEPNEGMLGYIEDPNANDQAIIERWGGSTYRVEGLNAKGQHVKSRTFKLAGDPIFVSAVEEERWRKSRGLPPRGQAATPTAPSISPQELIALMDEREAKRRAEQVAAEERQREKDREAAEQRRREEREWQAAREREQREWDERRKKDDEERDRRRRAEIEEAEARRKRDDAEREAQRKRDEAERAERDQKFMMQMIAMQQEGAKAQLSIMREALSQQRSGAQVDPAEAMMKGVKLAMDLREAAGTGDEKSVFETVFERVPDIIGGITEAVKQGKSSGGGGGGLTLPPGPVSEKFGKVVEAIQARGGDPEKALSILADRLLAGGGGGGAARPAEQRSVNAAPAETPPASNVHRPVVFDPGPPGDASGPAPSAPASEEKAAPVTVASSKSGKFVFRTKEKNHGVMRLKVRAA